MTPFEAPGSIARRSPAAPATSAAAADVPLTASYPPFVSVVRMSTPGAAMKVSGPLLLAGASRSVRSVEATPTTPRSPAG